MLKEILSNLGLGEDETKTYLALLEIAKPVTAGTLAKQMGVPRPSLYGFLKRLHGYGLIIQSKNLADVTTFIAESPDKVNFLIEQKLEKLQKVQQIYKNLLPKLRAQQAVELVSPRFQYFEGNEGVKHVLKDMLLYSDLKTQAFWPIKEMVEILSSDFFRYHNKQRIKNNLFTRAIWPQKHMVDIAKHPYLGVGKAFKREIRIAPKEIDFSMGYWIYGNKVAFISSKRESFGFIIESAEFVGVLQAQFEVIWKLSKKLAVDNKTTQEFLKEITAAR